jgi:hypothetical protein
MNRRPEHIAIEIKPAVYIPTQQEQEQEQQQPPHIAVNIYTPTLQQRSFWELLFARWLQ